MFEPKNRKFMKDQKGRNKGLSFNANSISFGKFGLKAISRGRVTSRQLESARRVIAKYIKRDGKIWIRVFPDKAISKKPIEVRMGNGKGEVSYYVFEVKPGRILYEMDFVEEQIARKALNLAAFKLPLKTIFINF